MARLLIFVILACVVLRMATGKWPWQLWQSSQRSQDEASARALLGLGYSASRDEILQAHRRLLMQVHPDRGGNAEATRRANAARDILLARLARTETENP